MAVARVLAKAYKPKQRYPVKVRKGRLHYQKPDGTYVDAIRSDAAKKTARAKKKIAAAPAKAAKAKKAQIDRLDREYTEVMHDKNRAAAEQADHYKQLVKLLRQSPPKNGFDRRLRQKNIKLAEDNISRKEAEIKRLGQEGLRYAGQIARLEGRI